MPVSVPELRLRALNAAPLRPERDFVLYWMVAARRARSSFALDHALALCAQLDRPLLVLEPLRADYPYASDRFHAFIVEGMRDNERDFASHVTYYPYVEPRAGAARGLITSLGARAVAVVTDEWPSFFIPHMQQAAAARLDVHTVAVDGNGLIPLRAAPRTFARAVDLRRFFQREALGFLSAKPSAEPFSGYRGGRAQVPAAILQRWPRAELPTLLEGEGIAALPVDHAVRRTQLVGGSAAGARALARFVTRRLGSYAELRHHPDEAATSELSPYLHFGHLGPHEVFWRVAEQARLDPERLAPRRAGQRQGFFGVSDSAEAFFDQLVVWRELGFNASSRREDYAAFDATPDWAKATLAEHAADARPALYDLSVLESAATADPLWNAAQRQLVTQGVMHGYLRMLWGKKVLEWSPTPRQAFERLVYLNDKYALDGRDPNSYNGIGWVFGRYDRPWAPKRPVFGSVRCMTSNSTLRKLRLEDYLSRYGPGRGAE